MSKFDLLKRSKSNLVSKIFFNSILYCFIDIFLFQYHLLRYIQKGSSFTLFCCVILVFPILINMGSSSLEFKTSSQQVLCIPFRMDFFRAVSWFSIKSKRKNTQIGDLFLNAGIQLNAD